jgi:type II secretory pathway component GspD/PulD (secretin)
VTAEIQETENVIIQSTTQTFVPNVGIQTITTFTQLGLPIDLKVTPRITDDGRITTTIIASITSQTGPALSSAAPPPTNVQTANTTLTTKNGETIVIGGLVRDVVQDTVNGVPLLSSIPIIGTLFQEHDKTSRKEELIIFITPTLLED